MSDILHVGFDFHTRVSAILPTATDYLTVFAMCICLVVWPQSSSLFDMYEASARTLAVLDAAGVRITGDNMVTLMGRTPTRCSSLPMPINIFSGFKGKTADDKRSLPQAIIVISDDYNNRRFTTKVARRHNFCQDIYGALSELQH